jgi:hypothetical protein
VKFFLEWSAFAMDEYICKLDSVCSALPAVPHFYSNADGSAVATGGYIFPPHSVSEWAEPLEAWMTSNTADLITCLQARLSLITALHALGSARMCSMHLPRCAHSTLHAFHPSTRLLGLAELDRAALDVSLKCAPVALHVCAVHVVPCMCPMHEPCVRSEHQLHPHLYPLHAKESQAKSNLRSQLQALHGTMIALWCDKAGCSVAHMRRMLS